jgi:hypothetical protein
MKALEFLIWLRDEVGVIRHSKEGECLAKPSNGELRRWIRKEMVRVNWNMLTIEDEVKFPIRDLVLFPNNDKRRVTII